MWVDWRDHSLTHTFVLVWLQHISFNDLYVKNICLTNWWKDGYFQIYVPRLEWRINSENEFRISSSAEKPSLSQATYPFHINRAIVEIWSFPWKTIDSIQQFYITFKGIQTMSLFKDGENIKLRRLWPFPLPLLVHTLSDLLWNISWAVSVGVRRFISSGRKSWRHTGSESSCWCRITRRETGRHLQPSWNIVTLITLVSNFLPGQLGFWKSEGIQSRLHWREFSHEEWQRVNLKICCIPPHF